MTQKGTDRITAAFTQAHKSQTAALMPYFTLGYPDAATSLAIIEAIAANGAAQHPGVAGKRHHHGQLPGNGA